MHDNHEIVENRIRREVRERIAPAEVIARRPLDVTAHELPGEPVPVTDVDDAEFVRMHPGEPWGLPWGTTWMHVTGDITAPFDGSGEHHTSEPTAITEVVVDLGFTPTGPGFQAEGAVYVDGEVICGVHPLRRAVDLSEVERNGRVDFLVEAASNPDFSRSFRPNPLGLRETAGTQPLYVFGGVDMVLSDPQVRTLVAELRCLRDLMATFAVPHRRHQRLLHVIERTLDTIDPDDVRGTARAAREVLAEGFAARAPDSAHRISAIGHAHIDTAWLWPLRETKRKCTRTFANAVQLMDTDADHRFACSQAVQYAWIEELHPRLFERIADKVADGQWIPVGGMWVEADMNLPSGESLVRQLVHGQRWFESRFGHRCTEVWIPDVFGYPGNLPQIFVAGGCRRFLTQKLSWNKQNRFPHHSFVWEGIDGSEVLTHFPPVDTYNADVRPRELAHAEASFADHYWSDHSLMPFGYGDGGGGPTREMAHRHHLLRDVEGLPKLTVESPSDFFAKIEAEIDAGAPVPRWHGELYFEMHRGTFTSQIETKVGNRRCEEALREAELWLAALGDSSRADTLDRLWKRVLTQQFHDILPGSSIAWVHEDAEREHSEVREELDGIIDESLRRLAPAGATIVNPASHARDEVVVCAVAPTGDGPVQEMSHGRRAFRASAPGMGLGPARAMATDDEVEVVATDAGRELSLRNGSVEVTVRGGEIISVVALRADRELLWRGPTHAHGAAPIQLTLAPDLPVEYDAWDLEEWTPSRAEPLGTPDSFEVVESGPLVTAVCTTWTVNDSTFAQTVILRAGSSRVDLRHDIDWQEREKLLSLDIPLDVRTDSARCEIQFGHESRPTHSSTSWDAAKFEVCAQRWVDLSEPDFGVAVINDGRFGHGVQGTSAGHPGVRVSLLRGARYPDPEADRGSHSTTVALLPHGPGLHEVLAEAEALNMALRVVEGGTAQEIPAPLVTVHDPRVLVSAVKSADDGSGELVVRLWEATGSRVTTTLDMAGGIQRAWACNVLEEALDERPNDPSPRAMATVDVVDGRALVELRPFRMATVRIVPAAYW